ncbi:hypothetical protein BVY04_03245 [bacterium M21]|nr:hypothetical protein BVY04_03245 [bacterium M21]
MDTANGGNEEYQNLETIIMSTRHKLLRSLGKGIRGWAKQFALAAIVFLAMLEASADVNVLIIGASIDSSEYPANGSYGERSADSEAFAATEIRRELQSILAGAGEGTVNVTLQDRTDRGIYSYTYGLAQWYHYPKPADVETTTRWPNLRGEGGTQWDYVVLIGDPYTMEYMPGLYAQGVASIGNEVAKGSAETVLLMPWPASGSSSSVAHYKDVVYRVGRSGGYKVAPAALAWQADGSPIGGTHPSTRGAYICAASIYSRLWGQSAASSSYTYDDDLADAVYTTVTNNIGVPQYSGTFDFENPFLILGDTRRDVHFSEKGTSTEEDYKNGVAGAMHRCRVSYDHASYCAFYTDKYSSDTPEDDGLGWPVNKDMPIAWNHGRFGYLPKEYVVNSAYWQLGMGFYYQGQTFDKPVAEANDYQIARMFAYDMKVAHRMISQNTGRCIPWRHLWAQIHKEYPNLRPLRDSLHINAELRGAVGTYMYTLYSARCPLNPKPNPVTTSWFAQKVAYETAWRAGRCQARAPGFKVLPASATALTLTPTTTQGMSVQFILPPQKDVTVNVSVPVGAAAIVSPKTLTFRPDNHDTAQSVIVAGLPGALASQAFTVEYLTSSSDVVYDGLSDSWAYTNNRATTETLTVVELADRQESMLKNNSKTISLNVAGSTEGNTVITTPFHGSLTWSGSDVIYTPNTDYVGADSFAFAVNVNGILTKGYIAITVEDVPKLFFAHTDGATSVVEGGAGDTYTVVLNKASDGDVTVDLSTGDQVTVSPTRLVFLKDEWDVRQTVTVSAVNDSDHELIHSGTITHTTTCNGDPEWDGVGANFDVPVVDDDNDAPIVDAGNSQTASLVAGNAPPPMAGADIFLDAGQDDGSNATWEDTLSAWNLSLDSTTEVVTHIASPATALPGITGAYAFPGGQSGNGGGSGASFLGMGWETEDVTIEIWFKPDSTTDDGLNNGQILFETGGVSGLGLFYNDGTIEVGHDTTEVISSVDISSVASDFIQVVLTYDITDTDDFVLYRNGEQVAAGNRTGTAWSGGDMAGLGARGGGSAGGRGGGDVDTESFKGQIAIFRAYRSQILSASEVETNYESIAGGSSVTVDLSSASVTDVDGDTLTSSWTTVSGPAVVTFGDASSIDTTATFREVGTYVLRLTATDGVGEDYDDVTIVINASGTLTVNYDDNGSNGGSVPLDSSAYTANDTVTVLGNTSALTKVDSVFTGWGTASDGIGDSYTAGEEFTITSPVVLYAQWADVYTLTVNNGSGSGDYAEGAVVDIVANIPANHDFVNWTGETTGIADVRSASTKITMPASAVTVTANTTIKTYTVTFVEGANGAHTGGGALVQTVAHGSGAVAPEITANTGYTFTGWDIAFDNVTAGLTVTAQYAQLYTLTVNNGSGSGDYIEGAVIDIVADIPANHDFVDWTGDTTGVADVRSASTKITMPASAVTVTANTTIKTYTVTFVEGANGTHTGGGALVQTVAHGSGAVAPEITANTGYTFTGWDIAFNNVTTELTVTAQYSATIGTVTLSVDNTKISESGGIAAFTATLSELSALNVTVDLGFDGTASATDYHASSSQIIIYAGSKTGSIDIDAVDDFDVEPDETVVVSITSVTNGLEDGEQEKQTQIIDDDGTAVHTVTFVIGANGTHTGGGALVQTVAHGSGAVAPEITANTGYTFTGWDIAFDDITTELTVTAQYAQLYTLTVNNGSGSGNYVEGTIVTIVADIPANHDFVNWTDDTTGVADVKSASTTIIMPASIVTVTGNTAIRTYTVTFVVGDNGAHTGGGSLIQTVAHGSGAVAPEITANTGYTFTGWDIAFDDITTELTVTAQYSPVSGVGGGSSGGGSSGGGCQIGGIAGIGSLLPLILMLTAVGFTRNRRR